MERNAFLAIILSGLVLILYYQFFLPHPTPIPPQTPPGPSPVATARPTPHGVVKDNPLILPSSPELSPKIVEEKTVFETPSLRAEFSSLGGRAVSWKMKQYKKTAEAESPLLDLLENAEAGFPFGLFLTPGGDPLPLEFSLVSKKSEGIVYHAQTPQLEIEKVLLSSDRDYAMDVHFKITNRSEENVHIHPGMRLAAFNDPNAKSEGFFIFKMPPAVTTPVYLLANSVKRIDGLEDLEAKKIIQGDVAWIGLEDRYFIRAIVARALSTQNSLIYGKEGDLAFAGMQYPSEVLAPGRSHSFAFTVYLGPKDLSKLKPLGVYLTKAVNLGWFGFIGEPLLWSLKFLYSLLHSWGLAIIALTLIIKLLLHPISKKSMKSMKAMQQLQPKLKELREKYKGDKQRLNIETMNLFRANKVNPMGGCLPMVLQMPIYIALYNVFFNSIDLYHTSFLFYQDLAAPDPYYISPILLGVFLVLQQKLTPQSTMDPAQQKIMMLMPLMFTVFLLYLPSGLVLYIFVNTSISVVQQYMLNKDIGWLTLIKRIKK